MKTRSNGPKTRPNRIQSDLRVIDPSSGVEREIDANERPEVSL